MRVLPRTPGHTLEPCTGARTAHKGGSVNIKKASMRSPVLQADTGTGQFRELESARRRLAIRLVTALSAAGLLIVLVNWISNS